MLKAAWIREDLSAISRTTRLLNNPLCFLVHLLPLWFYSEIIFNLFLRYLQVMYHNSA
jgi:hypothetical protein